MQRQRTSNPKDHQEIPPGFQFESLGNKFVNVISPYSIKSSIKARDLTCDINFQ